MADDSEEVFGRRSADRYPGPEAIGLLFAQLQRDIAEIKADIKQGFRDVGDTLGQHNDRISALERFRERAEERDRALAKSEGDVVLSPAKIGLLIAAVGLIVSIVTVLVSTGGHP